MYILQKNLSSLRTTIYQEKFIIAEGYCLCMDIVSSVFLYTCTSLTELTVLKYFTQMLHQK